MRLNPYNLIKEYSIEEKYCLFIILNFLREKLFKV
jgi:hypothetical protein